MENRLAVAHVPLAALLIAALHRPAVLIWDANAALPTKTPVKVHRLKGQNTALVTYGLSNPERMFDVYNSGVDATGTRYYRFG